MRTWNLTEEAVLRTLAYSSVFYFPLTFQEIYSYCIASTKYPRRDLLRALQTLKNAHVIEQSGEYWNLSLEDKKYVNRDNAWDEARRKEKQALRVATWIGKIPTVLGVFLTGGVSVGNAQKEDDIDFFVVTKTGWLWTTRLCIVLISKIIGKYRSRVGGLHENAWCFNLWLDESSLSVPEDARNIYTAHEVVQAKPLIEKKHISLKFLFQNMWVGSYFPNMKFHRVTNISSGYISPIEKILYTLQKTYMKRHVTRESVSLHSAFFHPRDTSSEVQKKYSAHITDLHLVPFPAYGKILPSKVYIERKVHMILNTIHALKMDGKKIVLVTGVFDLLHEEHKNFLKRAKEEGDVLVVCVESDKRTREMKGKGRPIWKEKKRLLHIKELSYVDEAFILPEDFSHVIRYSELLFYVRPDIYACSQHTLYQENKQKLMNMFGGKLTVVYPHVGGVSTTHILSSKKR